MRIVAAILIGRRMMPGFFIARSMRFCVPARDLLGLEAVELLAHGLALAQDGDPRQAGLVAVELELLPQRAAVALGHAPFGVVIAAIEFVGRGGPAAGDVVELFHSGASSSGFRFAGFGEGGEFAGQPVRVIEHDGGRRR